MDLEFQQDPLPASRWWTMTRILHSSLTSARPGWPTRPRRRWREIRTPFWKKLDADKSDRWRTGCEEKVPKNLNLRKARGSRRRARTKAPRGKARKSDGLRKKLCINRGTSIANFFFRKEEGSLLKEVSSQCLRKRYSAVEMFLSTSVHQGEKRLLA